MASLLPVALAGAILANALVAWTPRYWSTTVGIAGVSLVAVIWALAWPRAALSKETLVVALIGLWGPLQLTIGVSVLPVLTVRSSVIWMMCAVTFIVASQVLREKPDQERFLRTILWGTTGIAVVAMLQAYRLPVMVFGIFPADPSVVGTLYYKNHFAGLMELAGPIALWEVRNGKVLAGGLSYGALFAATVVSLSRAGTIGMATELVIFIAIMVFSRQWRMKPALGAVALVIAMAAGASTIAGTQRLWDRMQESSPYHLRAQIARSTFDMIAERPLLGFGMGTWRPVYRRFARLDDGLIVNEAHNDLAQWASEGGIPFLLFMTGLVVWLGPRALRSMWGFGIIVVFAHCYVDYILRVTALQFLWFALAGGLGQNVMSRERHRSDSTAARALTSEQA